MKRDEVGLEMGMILCKQCEALLGTFDAEKVTTYYVDCKNGVCEDQPDDAREEQQSEARAEQQSDAQEARVITKED